MSDWLHVSNTSLYVKHTILVEASHFHLKKDLNWALGPLPLWQGYDSFLTKLWELMASVRSLEIFEEREEGS